MNDNNKMRIIVKKDVDNDESSSYTSIREYFATSSACQSLNVSCNNVLRSDLSTRIISGSIGSLVTSLLVTPLEVVKIRLQASIGEETSFNNTLSSSSLQQQQQQRVTATTTTASSSLKPCPKGCGTIVLYNGHLDCVLSRSWLSFFDPCTGKLRQRQHPQTSVQLQSSSSSSSSVFSVPKSTVAAGSTTATVTNPIQSSSTNNIGTIAMLRRIFAQEGLTGIYAGLRPTLVMAVPNTVLYFSAYDELVYRFKKYYHDNTNNNNNSTTSIHSLTNRYISETTISTVIIPLISGAVARLVSSTITSPFELLRTRQAAETGTGITLPSNRVGMWHEFKYITQTEGGYRSLFQGLKPTLYRDVPFSAIYWVCIEQFKLLWIQQHDSIMGYNKILSPMEQSGQAFVNGAVAGMIAAACTTPFDVIKTRQQARSIEQIAIETINSSMIMNGATAASSSSTSNLVCNHNGMIAVVTGTGSSSTDIATGNVIKNSNTNISTIQYLRHIAQTEGITALWKGNQARMLKVAPSCAIMISSYELGKLLLQKPSSSSE